ncbi:dTMP kinase [Paracidovorax valerianellae]|uniref:Thymidylate kinase n=1 Tax=Paracidovorax valerianellae TaxID=187868 RepID=A0A1G6JZU0_9BURK|nr:dTMP kinase [Paracidovorax valerianellae]MDA8445229.1 dTMP kinase [Paracidovorax valerianellae]SDC23905.1 dTMP kinase [Paracidovorax valerianellae]
MIKPIFVVFEGLDGSGTSTQAIRLENFWRSKSLNCCLTEEPSPGPVGQMIRQVLKGRLLFSNDPIMFDRQLAYLFAADRFDHLNNDIDGVVSLLNRGISVISTRYIASSYAYHCGSEADWQRIQELNKEFPDPSLLIYLRNPVKVSVQRMKNRTTLDAYENPDKLTIASENYERFLLEYKSPLLVLDATLSPDKIHESVLQAIDEISGGK